VAKPDIALRWTRVLILGADHQRRHPAVAPAVVDLRGELGELDPHLGLDRLGRPSSVRSVTVPTPTPGSDPDSLEQGLRSRNGSTSIRRPLIASSTGNGAAVPSRAGDLEPAGERRAMELDARDAAHGRGLETAICASRGSHRRASRAGSGFALSPAAPPASPAGAA